MNDNLDISPDGCLHLVSAPHLRFSAKKIKDCETCFHDPTYPELAKGIVCKSTIDCVDEDQWKKKKYKVLKADKEVVDV